MSNFRFKIIAAAAAFVLMSACQQEPKKDTTADPEPFWQAKPLLPFKPSDFCKTSERLMSSLPNSTNFRCKDGIGGVGARIDVSNIQIVLLQGAQAEWFMFAYELQEGGQSAISDQTLPQLQREFEQALRGAEAD